MCDFFSQESSLRDPFRLEIIAQFLDEISARFMYRLLDFVMIYIKLYMIWNLLHIIHAWMFNTSHNIKIHYNNIKKNLI